MCVWHIYGTIEKKRLLMLTFNWLFMLYVNEDVFTNSFSLVQQVRLSLWAVMLFMDCKMVDALRGRRRLRVSVFKPPCSFWFLLLFGVGGLVLFIHLQDLSDMVLQQSPGKKKRTIMINHQHAEWIQIGIRHVCRSFPSPSWWFIACGFSNGCGLWVLFLSLHTGSKMFFLQHLWIEKIAPVKKPWNSH